MGTPVPTIFELHLPLKHKSSDITPSSQTIKRTATAISVAVGASDNLIGVTATPLTITLPAASVGRVVIIKDESGTANGTTNILTIATPGAETIDGAASATIVTAFGSLTLYSDGTNWFSI